MGFVLRDAQASRRKVGDLVSLETWVGSRSSQIGFFSFFLFFLLHQSLFGISNHPCVSARVINRETQSLTLILKLFMSSRVEKLSQSEIARLRENGESDKKKRSTMKTWGYLFDSRKSWLFLHRISVLIFSWTAGGKHCQCWNFGGNNENCDEWLICRCQVAWKVSFVRFDSSYHQLQRQQLTWDSCYR